MAHLPTFVLQHGNLWTTGHLGDAKLSSTYSLENMSVLMSWRNCSVLDFNCLEVMCSVPANLLLAEFLCLLRDILQTVVSNGSSSACRCELDASPLAVTPFSYCLAESYLIGSPALPSSYFQPSFILGSSFCIDALHLKVLPRLISLHYFHCFSLAPSECDISVFTGIYNAYYSSTICESN